MANHIISDKEYKLLVETSPDCIKIFDIKGNLLYINKGGLKEHFLKNAEEAKKWDYFSSVAPEDRLKYKKAIADAIKNGKTITLQVKHTPKGSNREFCSISITPIKNTITSVLAVSRDITDIKKAEEKYRVLIENISEFIFMIDKQDKVLSLNKAAARLFGLEPGELIGKSIFDLFPKEIATKYSKSLRNAFKTGKGGTYESKMVVGGKEFQINTNLNPVKGQEGKTIAVLGVSRDVTKQKLAEEALRDSEERLQTIIRTIPDSMDIVDENRNILWMGGKFLKIFGKKAIGKKCYETYMDNKKQCEKCPLKKPIKVGETKSFIISGVCGGKTFELTHTGMLSKGKKVILEVFRDVTERKMSEIIMEKLSTALRQTADMVVITDINGLIEYVNPAFEKQTGYTKEEVIGKTPRILKSGKQNQSFYKRLWNTVLSGKVFRATIINKKKSGELYYVEKTITPIKDKQGNITNFVATDKDITERMLAEEALKESEKKYRTLADNALIGIFKTNIKGDILYVNKTLTKMFEFSSPEEFISTNALTRYKNPHDRETLIEQLKKNGKVSGYEIEMLTKTGKTKQILISATLDMDNLSGMLIDITERKKLEVELAKSKALLENSIEQMPIGIQIASAPDVNIFMANKEAGKMIGQHVKQQLKVSIKNPPEWKFLYPDRKTCKIRDMPLPKAVLKGEATKDKEYIIKQKSGKEIWALVNAVPIRNSKGEIIAGVATGIDITEKKRSEKELERYQKHLEEIVKERTKEIEDSRNLFISALEQIPAAVQIADEKMNIISVNKESEMLLKQPKEEQLKLSPSNLPKWKFLRPDRTSLEPLDYPLPKAVLKGGITKNEEFIIVRENGEEVWVMINAIPVKDKKGKLIAGFAVGLDITEKKKDEQELENYRSHLEDLVKDKTEELQTKIEELEKFNKLAVGRELKMIELKKRILELEPQLGGGNKKSSKK